MKQCIPTVAFIFLAGQAIGQAVLYRWDNPHYDGNFSHNVDGVGDLNQDGFADVLVSSPDQELNWVNHGIVRVYSGRDGTLMCVFDCPGTAVGVDAGGVGDINADGYPDIAIGGVPHNTPFFGMGRVDIYSGKDFSLIQLLFGTREDEFFGYQLAGAGDVDRDGHDDVLVASLIRISGERFESGEVRVISGKNGSELFAFAGVGKFSHLGADMIGVGDVNQDGHDDFLIGEPGVNNQAGRVWLHSGRDGSVLFQMDGSEQGESLGGHVDCAGDLNRDGVPDFVVLGTSVQAVSGADYSVMYEIDETQAGGTIGSNLSAGGDFNGDKTPDIAVSVFDTEVYPYNSVKLFSGVCGKHLYTFHGEGEFDFFGFSSDFAGDVNGDGFADLILGSHEFGIGEGYAKVYAGNDLILESSNPVLCAGSSFELAIRNGPVHGEFLILAYLESGNVHPAYLLRLDLGLLDVLGEKRLAVPTDPTMDDFRVHFIAFTRSGFRQIQQSATETVMIQRALTCEVD